MPMNFKNNRDIAKKAVTPPMYSNTLNKKTFFVENAMAIKMITTTASTKAVFLKKLLNRFSLISFSFISEFSLRIL
ncbi:hypothetical protein ES708_25346 [subsurface metagenome]